MYGKIYYMVAGHIKAAQAVVQGECQKPYKTAGIIFISFGAEDKIADIMDYPVIPYRVFVVKYKRHMETVGIDDYSCQNYQEGIKKMMGRC